MRQKLSHYNVNQKYTRLMFKVKGDPSSKKIFSSLMALSQQQIC